MSSASAPPDPHESGRPIDLGTVEEDLHDRVRHLKLALETRPIIDHAIGILMMRFGVDDHAAFAILRHWSQHANLKLRDIAAALDVLVGGADGAMPPAAALKIVVERLQEAAPAPADVARPQDPPARAGLTEGTGARVRAVEVDGRSESMA